MKEALRNLGTVHKKYVQKALVTALNKVGAEVVTQAKRELKDATGLKAGTVGKKIAKDKARRGDEEYTIRIKSRYLNLLNLEHGKQRRACQLKHGVRENYTNTLLWVVEETLGSDWFLVRREVIQRN